MPARRSGQPNPPDLSSAPTGKGRHPQFENDQGKGTRDEDLGRGECFLDPSRTHPEEPLEIDAETLGGPRIQLTSDVDQSHRFAALCGRGEEGENAGKASTRFPSHEFDEVTSGKSSAEESVEASKSGREDLFFREVGFFSEQLPGRFESDIAESDIAESDITESDITESDTAEVNPSQGTLGMGSGC